MIARMRKLHIYLGLATAVILVLVTVTGVLLLHKKALGLNEIIVRVPGYSTAPTVDVWDVVITDNGEPLVATKQGVFKEIKNHRWQLVLNMPARKLYVHKGIIYAGVKTGLQESRDQGATWQQIYTGQEVLAMNFQENNLFIATPQGVYKGLVDNNGQWTVAQSYPIKMPEVRAIAIKDNQIVTASKEGVFLSQGKTVARTGKLPIQDKNGGKVELQKVIKDLHTGDFFGSYSYVMMDSMSLGIVIVTVTGAYLWYRFRLRKQRNG